VLAHRAVNTLDAMVGHHDSRYEQFGWASARLDDVANYVPARLTAAAVAAMTPRRARSIWTTVRRDAAAHPSPNAGVIEAAVAAALGVRLGGTNRYGGRIEDRGVLGDGPAPTVADGRRALRLTIATDVMIAVAITLIH
jgi:adenosylcobinamide-phosphate synthase